MLPACWDLDVLLARNCQLLSALGCFGGLVLERGAREGSEKTDKYDVWIRCLVVGFLVFALYVLFVFLFVYLYLCFVLFYLLIISFLLFVLMLFYLLFSYYVLLSLYSSLCFPLSFLILLFVI